MRNYDEIEGFIDYSNEGEWKRYIETHVIPLWRNTCLLKEYFEELKSEFGNLPFSEVDDRVKPLFLGGIAPNRDDIHSKNSLAKFYAKFFGLQLRDVQSWILQAQTGETLAEIEVEVAETEFIKFVKNIFELLDHGLQSQQSVIDFREPEVDYEELKKEPDKLKDIIKDFYQCILNISQNYNYGTFLLCSVNQITYRYMKAAYPRIDGALDFLRNEFGLTELEWDNPIKPDSNIFKDYTIYCFPEYDPGSKGKSFGGSICAVNEMIWKAFLSYSAVRDIFGVLFGDVPDINEQFKEKIKSRIPERYCQWIYYKSITASENRANVQGGDRTIMDMLDENSPHLFTNQIKITYISDEALNFSSVGV